MPAVAKRLHEAAAPAAAGTRTSGDVAGARHGRGEDWDAAQPQRGGAGAAQVHGAAGVRKVISERSPSA